MDREGRWIEREGEIDSDRGERGRDRWIERGEREREIDG